MRQHVVDMLHGPGTLRFIVQPAIAIVLGVMHGLHDRRGFRAGLRAIVVPLVVALGASLVFQYLVVDRVRLAYALVYAALFVAVPYFVARALANRFSTTPRVPSGPTAAGR